MNLVQRALLVSAVAIGTAARSKAVDGTAFVNMETLFQGYWRTARSDAAFNKQKELYKEHAENLRTELDGLKKRGDEEQEKALNIALSDEARGEHRSKAEEANSLFQEKRKELREFLMRTDKELQQKYLELRAEIVKEISAFIKTYGKENGYGMIMDSSGLTRNFIPVIVYYPEERDITDKVMAELNRGHEDDVPKPRDAAAAGAKDAAPTAAGDEGQAE